MGGGSGKGMVIALLCILAVPVILAVLACLLRNRPASLFSTHQLYEAAFASVAGDDGGIKETLQTDKLCDFAMFNSDKPVVNQEYSSSGRNGTMKIRFWSAMPEAELRRRLNGLKLPPGCTFASLRILSGPAEGPSPAPVEAEKPQ